LSDRVSTPAKKKPKKQLISFLVDKAKKIEYLEFEYPNPAEVLFRGTVAMLLMTHPTRMMAALIFLLFFSAFHSTVCADLFSEYAHHAVLDAEGKMKLLWTIDWDAETVSFAVEAETTGWVGFGFSTGSGQMIGSDVVIGWVKDNKGYLTVTVLVYSVMCTLIS